MYHNKKIIPKKVSLKIILFSILFLYTSCGDLILSSSDPMGIDISLQCIENFDVLELKWKSHPDIVNYVIYKGNTRDLSALSDYFPDSMTEMIIFNSADDISNTGLIPDQDGFYVYSDFACDSDEVYWYQVKALLADGSYVNSNFVSGKLAIPDFAFRGERQSDNSVKFYWNKVDKAVAYSITDGNNEIVSLESCSSSLQLDESYTAGIRYVFHDQRYLTEGDTEYILNILTEHKTFSQKYLVAHDPCLNLQLSVDRENKITCFWKSVPSAETYLFTLVSADESTQEETSLVIGEDEGESALIGGDIVFPNAIYEIEQDSQSILKDNGFGLYERLYYTIDRQFLPGAYEFILSITGEEKTYSENKIIKIENGFGLHSSQGSLANGVLSLSWEDSSLYTKKYVIDKKKNIYSLSSGDITEESYLWTNVTILSTSTERKVSDTILTPPAGLSYKYIYRINALDQSSNTISTVYYEIQI